VKCHNVETKNGRARSTAACVGARLGSRAVGVARRVARSALCRAGALLACRAGSGLAPRAGGAAARRRARASHVE
jgi:hypothetical protein